MDIYRELKAMRHELGAHVRLEGASKTERHRQHHRECQAFWRAKIADVERLLAQPIKVGG